MLRLAKTHAGPKYRGFERIRNNDFIQRNIGEYSLQSTLNEKKTNRFNYSNFKTKYTHISIFMNENDNFDLVWKSLYLPKTIEP